MVVESITEENEEPGFDASDKLSSLGSIACSKINEENSLSSKDEASLVTDEGVPVLVPGLILMPEEASDSYRGAGAKQTCIGANCISQLVQNDHPTGAHLVDSSLLDDTSRDNGMPPFLYSKTKLNFAKLTLSSASNNASSPVTISSMSSACGSSLSPKIEAVDGFVNFGEELLAIRVNLGSSSIWAVLRECHIFLDKEVSANSSNILITVVITKEWLRLIGSATKPKNIYFVTIPNVVPLEHVLGADLRGFAMVVLSNIEELFERLLDKLQLLTTLVIADGFVPKARRHVVHMLSTSEINPDRLPGTWCKYCIITSRVLL
ncbi:UDP-glucuronosyl and UDP-glucosyl transferase [Forsythia ovata]|uniref:UDP-glucuronosyl and UDP-glucosyl transferase n=1 Tax=Forsythia ovata TaxID=205694 RepID=A0ABD1TST6_9LAMI